MKYISQKTENGNVGYSENSQKDADMQALWMDNNNCYNCTNCNDCNKCYNCNNCDDCYNCTNCYNCNDCTNCTNCNNCNNCYNCTNCYKCNDCNNCNKCSDCYNCEGILHWRCQNKTTKLLALNGLTWPVATDGKLIQIGCQLHSVESWEGFSDEEISGMEYRALEFWCQYKQIILSLAYARKQLGE